MQTSRSGLIISFYARHQFPLAGGWRKIGTAFAPWPFNAQYFPSLPHCVEILIAQTSQSQKLTHKIWKPAVTLYYDIMEVFKRKVAPPASAAVLRLYSPRKVDAPGSLFHWLLINNILTHNDHSGEKWIIFKVSTAARWLGCETPLKPSLTRPNFPAPVYGRRRMEKLLLLLGFCVRKRVMRAGTLLQERPRAHSPAYRWEIA